MTAVRRFRIALLSTLALLFAGVANVHAHVHLCLDGQEPPATVHVESGNHIDHHLEEVGSHQDVDVDVPAQAIAQSIAKTLKFELPALGPAPALISLALPTSAARPVAHGLDPPPLAAPCSLRPPVRGPPL